METIDFKKLYKTYYQPKGITLIDVEALRYLCVEGKGDPNEVDGEYQQAIQLLYALNYTIKMSKKTTTDISGYFDYVVAPLEGLWWQEGIEGYDITQKEKFCWKALMLLPNFVDEEVFAWACQQVEKKKGLVTSKAKIITLEEGLCVTSLHIGSFDSEEETVNKMKQFILKEGYVFDYQNRFHHEIYLSDFRKVAEEKRKTILRLPIKKA